MNRMSLYYFPSCPFCVKVLHAIADLGIEGIELRDKNVHSEYAEELRLATGTQMVPCLRVESGEGDQWIHESDAIVSYLRAI